MVYPEYPYPLSDLVDRLSITQLKAINIPEYKGQYEKEMDSIMKDLDHLIEKENLPFSANMIRAIIIVALSNQCIWNNEDEARKGTNEQDKYLKFTHSVNGIRNTAKNIISREIGDREEIKVDCLAAEFTAGEFAKSHGNWDVFSEWKP